jgi:hypothetical protein
MQALIKRTDLLFKSLHLYLVIFFVASFLMPSVTVKADVVVSPIAVDEWSAHTLPAKTVAFGSFLEWGLYEGLMLGADPASLMLGIRTVHVKYQLPFNGDDDWAIGLKYAKVQKNNILNEYIRRDFEELDGSFLRPTISWSRKVSGRLTIHSYWASGIGSTRAQLSEDGKRNLWRAKHGDEPYPSDSGTPPGKPSSSNQQAPSSNEEASFARRGMQLQSIAGLTEDRFQITGDWERSDGNRILLSTRFERTRLEDLNTFSIRMTLAQQWGLDQFHLRLGAGPQYSILSGKDLDGEEIKAAGFLPAADLAFFWIY